MCTCTYAHAHTTQNEEGRKDKERKNEDRKEEGMGQNTIEYVNVMSIFQFLVV